jgi:transcriptional regulator with XRE-family HTH domain
MRGVPNYIRVWRKRARLNQKDLAAKIGMDRTSLSKLETGGRTRVDPELLERIAVAVGTDVASLLGMPPPAGAQEDDRGAIADEIDRLTPEKRALLRAFLKFLADTKLPIAALAHFFAMTY